MSLVTLRDEVADLEKAGMRAIQVDEPVIREGVRWPHHSYPSLSADDHSLSSSLELRRTGAF